MTVPIGSTKETSDIKTGNVHTPFLPDEVLGTGQALEHLSSNSYKTENQNPFIPTEPAAIPQTSFWFYQLAKQAAGPPQLSPPQAKNLPKNEKAYKDLMRDFAQLASSGKYKTEEQLGEALDTLSWNNLVTLTLVNIQIKKTTNSTGNIETLSFSTQDGTHCLVRVYHPKNQAGKPSVLTEIKTAKGAELYSGAPNMQEGMKAHLSSHPTLSELRSYFEIFSRAEAKGWAWDSSHRSVSILQSYQDEIKNLQSTPFIQVPGGYLPFDNHHGGERLMALMDTLEGRQGKINIETPLKLRLGKVNAQGKEQKISSIQLSPRQIFESERNYIKMPRPEDQAKGALPEIELPAGLGLKNNKQDIYKLLLFAMKHIPKEEWNKTFTTQHGESLTLNKVLQAFQTAWQNWSGSPQNSAPYFQHSHYHLTEVLLTHAELTRGNSPSAEAEQKIKNIQLKFLGRELSFNPENQDFSTVAHNFESLGLLLQHKKMWTATELQQARQWVRKAVAYYLENFTMEHATELAHFLKGLRALENTPF